MRTKNARDVDAVEAAYIEDAKRCACVVCQAKAPSAAHHPEQGQHMIVQALCWDCHQGPHGWHGDRSRWRAAKMTERKATNETARRVAILRATGQASTPIGRKAAQPRSGGQRKVYTPPLKQVPRPEAA